jgi:hypothetical protein
LGKRRKERPAQHLAAEGDVLPEPADELAVVAVQRGDDEPDPRPVVEAGVEAGGIEGEAAVAAGVDEGEERFVAHLHGDERRGLVAVVGDHGGVRRGRRRRGGHGIGGDRQLRRRVVEREQGVAEQRETDHAVDGHAEVGREVGEIVDDGRHPLEVRLAELEVAEDDGGQLDLAAVGPAHRQRPRRGAPAFLPFQDLAERG